MLNGHDPERARSALWSLDAGMERREWVRAGMAAKAAGQRGRAYPLTATHR